MLAHFSASATHIVGGELTYKHLGNDLFELKLKLYIDCFNGSSAAIAQDQYAILTVFTGDSGLRLPQYCQNVLRNDPVRVSKTNYNCIKIAPDACVDAYEYVTNVELPPRKDGYFISFQRCCRNGTIVNLINPLATGANIWTKMNDTLDIGYNSSPEFKNLPPNFLCTNAPLVFDHSATDPDGDSLVYEFFHPYTGANNIGSRPLCNQTQEPPFTSVNFNTGYTFNYAIPSNPSASLNSKTGLLRIVPTVAGQFVVGIVVKEFRQGKLIGYTQRDYQFNVQNCVFETTSAFVNPTINCNREVFFTNNSQNADAYHWDFGDTTTNQDTSNLKIGYYRYPGPGSYLVKLIASKGNCVDSISKLVTVFDRIKFKLPDDTTLCQGVSLQIKPDTIYQQADYTWNTGSKDSSILVNSKGEYWLNIKYGNCDTYDTVFVDIDTFDVELAGEPIRCDPQTFELSSWLKVIGRYRDINWSSEPIDLVPPGYKDSLLQIRKNGTYKIYGENANACPFEDTVVIDKADFSHYFKIGNVFTPNGDSLNEAFPDVHPPYRYHIQIFNRWGVKVFDGENQPWYAEDFADGMYLYFIRMEACGDNRELHGIVHVIHGKK